MLVRPDEIERLVDEYLSLAGSAENRRRLACWQPEICARDQFHGQPCAGAFRRHGAVPLQIDVQHSFFTQVLPQNLRDFYLDPASYLRFYLAKRIFAFRNIPDDTPLDGVVPIYGSTAFETSLFGLPYRLYPDREPLIDQSQPLLQSSDDLDHLPPLDFHRSGMLPMMHRLYAGVGELLRDRLAVVFTEWLRGPFGVALYLRGYQDLLADLASDPEPVSRLMARINQHRQAYCSARAAFLGQPLAGGSLFNDEIDAAVIGARHYRDFILPFEEAMARFHGHITYWHSCGNTAPMARDISGMGCIDLLDVSGWTDLETVLRTTDARRQRLEIRFNPVKDLQDASPEQMDGLLRHKLALCRQYDVPDFTFRVSGIQPWKDVHTDLAHVRTWLELARRAIGEEPN